MKAASRRGWRISRHANWRILYVAYPLLPVSEASCGGAEQVLCVLEREIRARGYHTVVAAAEGSRVAGEHFSTGAAAAKPDQLERREAEHTARILELVQRESFDLVHDEGGSFWRHAAAVPAPVVATLHLPRSFYPQASFSNLPSNLFFNCVSHSQCRSFADLPQAATVVRNGIPLEEFPFAGGKEEYLVWMGRICEEKGAHIAIEVAQRLDRPLVIAGQVYPFSYHQQYFDGRILPHLNRRDSRIYFVEKPSKREKLQLLRRAQAVLVPSLVDETSSLVSMEAMACGTPVIGFRRGAIPEVVVDGQTGFIVDSAEAMAAAVMRVRDLDPHACRAHVEANYSATRMADDYERMYHVVGFYSQLRALARAA